VDRGVLDLEGVFDALAEQRFEGTVSLELDLRPYLSDGPGLLEVLRGNRSFCMERLPAPA
jgi:hypothetical protein